MARPHRHVPLTPPAYRKLRGYAFDPSLSVAVETADMNAVLYRVRWEQGAADGGPFGPGPVGEYLEVIDFDPTVGPNGTLYAPVDLDDPYILADDGLPPSEGNPQFHQQYVYAVAMLTIQNFERALGRKVLWAPRLLEDRSKYEEFVRRLRIYPHALREANAYYSPQKKAILCGYFSASPRTAALHMPGALVFTCLSHDILAHEVAHAVLDGLHPRFNQATNPDVLAFHEAFADIVALFQHFTFPEVLRSQIARTRGRLDEQNLLGKLAQEVGVAIGQYGSLRDAIGSTDWDGKWAPAQPHPADYQTTGEPHARGSLLVAAVFEAFLAMYKGRVRDLLRVAANGSANHADGDLDEVLVHRLADEAATTASHVLTICVRALDYCPPVDITFGDFLRAIVTADADLVADDRHHYRLAFIEAFRRRGIYPRGVRTLSEESLRYRDVWQDLRAEDQGVARTIGKYLREYRSKAIYESDREAIFNTARQCIAGKPGKAGKPRDGLHERIMAFKDSPAFERITGLIYRRTWAELGVTALSGGDGPTLQILNLRLASRIGPDGTAVDQIVFGLVQRLGVVYEQGAVKAYYAPGLVKSKPENGVEVYGGCTLIFDLDTLRLRYAISKPLLAAESPDGTHALNAERIAEQVKYQVEDLPYAMSEVARYFGTAVDGVIDEPFALLHTR